MAISILANIKKLGYINMCWQIIFYNKKIAKNLISWPNHLKAKLVKILDLIKKEGPNLGMPLTRTMGSGLFEIRALSNNDAGRVFFSYIEKIYLAACRETFHDGVSKGERCECSPLVAVARTCFAQAKLN